MGPWLELLNAHATAILDIFNPKIMRLKELDTYCSHVSFWKLLFFRMLDTHV